MDDLNSPQEFLDTSSRGKVNPYSVIDITPIQLEQQDGSSSSSPSVSKDREGEVQDIHPSSPGVTSGYSVPVPCGYATPSGVPLLTPAYTTPVIIRHLSMDEDGNRNYFSEMEFMKKFQIIKQIKNIKEIMKCSECVLRLQHVPQSQLLPPPVLSSPFVFPKALPQGSRN